MKNFILLLLLIAFPFCFQLPAHELKMTLEHANTPEKKQWGLMGRHSLPQDWGMLFTRSPAAIISLWSFNCYADLDVAFLDAEGTIMEIVTLKAYPEMMDPNRPVRVIADLAQYPPHDPVTQFFMRNRIKSQQPAAYALETEAGFFKRNAIIVGDKIIMNAELSSASIIKQL